MNHFTIADLKRLLTIEDEICISLYMPTDPAATDETDRIRYKNLLRRAENAGRSRSAASKPLSKVIDKGRTLHADGDLWRTMSNGLAVFLTPEKIRRHQLPLSFEETVSVSTRPMIKPLLPLFNADGRFLVLALSQSGVRLLACTRHHAVEVDLPDLPENIDETLRYDVKRSQLQFHTGTAAGSGNRPAVFHGQGVGIDDRKDDVLRYFQDVDRRLPTDLAAPSVPLVLAGVDYLLPIFKEATSHPWVLDDAVTGNPEGLSVDELHARALPIVRPVLEKKQQKAESRYRAQAGLGRTAAGVENVVPAAVFGQVETLFISIDERRPGTFDRGTGQVIRLDTDSDGIEDLLDLAAAEALRNGGDVYAVRQERMPDAHAAAAALLRY